MLVKISCFSLFFVAAWKIRIAKRCYPANSTTHCCRLLSRVNVDTFPPTINKEKKKRSNQTRQRKHVRRRDPSRGCRILPCVVALPVQLLVRRGAKKWCENRYKLYLIFPLVWSGRLHREEETYFAALNERPEIRRRPPQAGSPRARREEKLLINKQVVDDDEVRLVVARRRMTRIGEEKRWTTRFVFFARYGWWLEGRENK